MTGRRNLGHLGELLFVVVVEILLYLRYQQGDGTFHYFTHFFAGASFALVLMTLAARRWRRPVRLPLLAVLAGHLFAMAPDLLYIDSVAHARWMDAFVAHNISHFLPGRNISWYVVFLAAMTLYLVSAPRGRHQDPLAGPGARTTSTAGSLAHPGRAADRHSQTGRRP